MDDYSAHYAVLGVDPDTDWNTLRGQYKRLIGQWHPDRFPSDPAGREIAEEQSKRMTIAYQALARYRREHGVLPRIEYAEPRAPGAATPWDIGAGLDQAPSEIREPSPEPGSAAGQPTSRGLRRRDVVVIVLCALITVLYAECRYTGERTSDAGERPRLEASSTPMPRREENKADARVVYVGSTLGEVYSIQGVPTATQGDVWYYGKSKISFFKGKVIAWDEHPENPLRIGRNLETSPREGYFSVGSTKDEVRSIEGAPITETESVWDYGQSQIYFERNHVVRWNESPLQPLHVAR
jgi:hypothetical protein